MYVTYWCTCTDVHAGYIDARDSHRSTFAQWRSSCFLRILSAIWIAFLFWPLSIASAQYLGQGKGGRFHTKYLAWIKDALQIYYKSWFLVPLYRSFVQDPFNLASFPGSPPRATCRGRAWERGYIQLPYALQNLWTRTRTSYKNAPTLGLSSVH